MSGRTERKIAWPLEAGVAPKINELVAGLVDEFELVRPSEGGQIILVEMSIDDGADFLRLTERLAAAWEARGLGALVVDAHPAEPFAADCFEGSPEGLTEIFHYGLSPEAAVRHRDGCSGLWVPAGGKWNLPLESPDEPQLTLFRLADLADKVLILADRDNAEGFLEAFRDRAHYRLILVSQDEAADLPSLPIGEPILPQATREENSKSDEPQSDLLREGRSSRVPVTLVEDEGGRGRRRLLIPLLLAIIALAWYFTIGPGRGSQDEETPEGLAASDSGFSHLPPPVALPYSGGSDEREEVAQELTPEIEEAEAVVAPDPQEPLRLGEGVYPDEESAVLDPIPEAERSSEPAAPVESIGEPPPVRATGTPRRRYESRESWRRTKMHMGDFYVHVESYQDSALGARSARERGFADVGFTLRSQLIRGSTYYRLLLGPFPAMSAAAAYRDSLLDYTEENYCTIAIKANE